jgi:hypothetical protein
MLVEAEGLQQGSHFGGKDIYPNDYSPTPPTLRVVIPLPSHEPVENAGALKAAEGGSQLGGGSAPSRLEGPSPGEAAPGATSITWGRGMGWGVENSLLPER